MKRPRLALALLGLAVGGSLAPAAGTGAALAAGRHAVPGTSCTVFPADDIWHADVSGLPGRTGNHDRTARAASTTK